jgi:hypothetical protein
MCGALQALANVILLGDTGSGKSWLLRLYSEILNWECNVLPDVGLMLWNFIDANKDNEAYTQLRDRIFDGLKSLRLEEIRQGPAVRRAMEEFRAHEAQELAKYRRTVAHEADKKQEELLAAYQARLTRASLGRLPDQLKAEIIRDNQEKLINDKEILIRIIEDVCDQSETPAVIFADVLELARSIYGTHYLLSQTSRTQELLNGALFTKKEQAVELLEDLYAARPDCLYHKILMHEKVSESSPTIGHLSMEETFWLTTGDGGRLAEQDQCRPRCRAVRVGDRPAAARGGVRG